MAGPTTQEMLENVDVAINVLMTGGAVQSYAIGGRNIQKMRLPELIELKKVLETRIAGTKTRTSYASFDDPS